MYKRPKTLEQKQSEMSDKELCDLLDIELTKIQTIYFQPKGINPKYCEVGMIHESDPDYIWYMDEPCKILISEVKIILKDQVFYNEKDGIYEVV